MRPIAALLATALLGGCALAPSQPPADPALADCRMIFARADAAVDAAGVRDGGEHRPAGFPYLRSNRFLASFAAALRPEQYADWLSRLHALERRARRAELANLNDPLWDATAQDILADCGRRWAARDAADPARMQALRRRVAVPDDYSLPARVLGAYPLARPFLRLGVEDFRAGIRRDFSMPLAALRDAGRWQAWSPDEPAGAPGDARRDALGIPQLSAAQRAGLFARHAPLFLVDARGDFDRPGRPLPRHDGQPGFMPQPRVYQQLAWTRFHGAVLPQLTYVIWFSQRPPQGPLDPYAGRLDGVMWRVTLDGHGRPLVYDTAHSCGCYHYVFPARDLEHRGTGPWQERPLQPQGQVPWDEVAVVLGSGDHYVRRVIPRQLGRRWAGAEPDRLAVRDYDALRSIVMPDGRRRSLFGPDGLIDGSERLERWWLWPSGVPDPGAMRQWGRHATAFVGRAHFDDPFQLEHWFLPGPAAPGGGFGLD